MFPRGDCYDDCYRDREFPFPDITGRRYLLHCSVRKNQENSFFNHRSDPDIYNTWALPIRHHGGVYSKHYGRLRSASHHYALIKSRSFRQRK